MTRTSVPPAPWYGMRLDPDPSQTPAEELGVLVDRLRDSRFSDPAGFVALVRRFRDTAARAGLTPAQVAAIEARAMGPGRA